MQFFQALLILGIVFLLGFTSTGLCHATYTDFDDNKRFTVRQQMGSETPTPESANTFEYNNFIVGTIGVHTVFEGRAFGGVTAHLGGRVKNRGFGLLGSYEGGVVEVLGYEMTAQIVNISAAGSYKLGNSTILISLGITGGYLSLEDFDEGVTGYGITSSFSYLYQPDNKFTLMLQARKQGKGIMLSAGVGF